MMVEGEPAEGRDHGRAARSATLVVAQPYFLPDLAEASPLFIYCPAHYLKQFHEKYGDPGGIAKMCEEDAARDWAQLHNRRDACTGSTTPTCRASSPGC